MGTETTGILAGALLAGQSFDDFTFAQALADPEEIVAANIALGALVAGLHAEDLPDEILGLIREEATKLARLVRGGDTAARRNVLKETARLFGSLPRDRFDRTVASARRHLVFVAPAKAGAGQTVIRGAELNALVETGYAKIRSQMLPVPGGTFDMGYDGPGALEYEKPVHKVTVSPFKMSKNDVTNAEYQEWVESLGENRFFLVKLDERGWPVVMAAGTQAGVEQCRTAMQEPNLQIWKAEAYNPYPNFNRPRQPVNVNKRSAQLYALMHGVRLATGVEMEYAASEGGRKREYAPEEIHTRHQDRDRNLTIDVDDLRYRDGPYGLRHLMGNVMKWVMDDYLNLYGASWLYVRPVGRRPSSRYTATTRGFRIINFGFRLVRPEDSPR